MGFLKQKSFLLRLASACVMAPLFLYIFWKGGVLFWAVLLLTFAVMVYEWISLANKTRFDFPLSIFGILYLAFCVTLFALLREQGPLVAITLALAVWATDIGAYFSGKIIGGVKLLPAISPNKTWAGLIGGMMMSVATFLIVASFTPFPEPFEVLVLLGIVVALSGQIGDLMISWLKRLANEKDTGTLIPGHGGLLDRVDGLLFASVAYFFLLGLLAL